MTATIHDTTPRTAVVRAALADPDEAWEAWRSLDGVLDLDTCWDPQILGLLGAVHANLASEAVSRGEPLRDDARLRGVHRHQWYLAQRCERNVDHVRAALDAEGITSGVVGGIAWCGVAGISGAERRVDDTTVVVAAHHLATATEVAARLGWSSSAHRHRPTRFARPRLLQRAVDPARSTAGRDTLRVAVRPHGCAPCPHGDQATVTGGDRELQFVVALLGGPTWSPDAGLGVVFDVVRGVRHIDLDLARVAAILTSWDALAEARVRLAAVTELFPTPHLEALCAALGGPSNTPVSPEVSRTRRWVREWRAVTRHDPWWAAPVSVPQFAVERAGVDRVRDVPGALRRRRGGDRR